MQTKALLGSDHEGKIVSFADGHILEDPAVQSSLLLKVKIHHLIGKEFIAILTGGGHGDAEGNAKFPEVSKSGKNLVENPRAPPLFGSGSPPLHGDGWG